jgi:hypothetical protein
MAEEHGRELEEIRSSQMQERLEEKSRLPADLPQA